jgi:hypothetical protein
MPYLGTGGAVDIMHLISFLGDSNLADAKCGDYGHCNAIPGRYSCYMNFLLHIYLTRHVHRAQQVTLFP